MYTNVNSSGIIAVSLLGIIKNKSKVTGYLVKEYKTGKILCITRDDMNELVRRGPMTVTIDINNIPVGSLYHDMAGRMRVEAVNNAKNVPRLHEIKTYSEQDIKKYLQK